MAPCSREPFSLNRLGNDVLTVTVRFTPTTAELERIRSSVRKERPRPSIPLTLTLSVLFLVQGAMRLAYPLRSHDAWLGYVHR